MITRPPFCPNPDCGYHHKENLPQKHTAPWYHKYGHYRTKLHKQIQRFICLSCNIQFSSQTFSIDYAVKRKITYKRLFLQLNSGSGIRFLSRTFGVTDKVILNRITRLAHQTIGMHASLRKELILQEDMTVDGFESFTGSQYFPNNIHILVGKDSQYLYGADYAHIRRKGRMRDEQKQRRKELETRFKPPKGEISSSFSRIMGHFLRYYERSGLSTVRIYSDEKIEYQPVLADICALTRQKVVHKTVSSRKERTLQNDLFAVNYFDREIRKDQGNHVRETVEFSRNVNNSMERLWVYGAYHNYVKPYRIRQSGQTKISHAERAGIPKALLRKEWKTFFTQRRFVSKTDLTESEWYLWYRCYRTPLKEWAEAVPAYMCA